MRQQTLAKIRKTIAKLPIALTKAGTVRAVLQEVFAIADLQLGAWRLGGDVSVCLRLQI